MSTGSSDAARSAVERHTQTGDTDDADPESGAIVVQSVALAAVGVVLGLVVGVALGRAVWSEFAAGLDVVVEVREPWPTVGTVVAGFLVVSGLVALLRPRLGRGVRSVDVLSAE